MGVLYKGKKEARVGNGFLKWEYSCLTPEQPNLEDEMSLRGVGLYHPGFCPFSFSFDFGLDLLFCGLVVLKPGEITLDSSPRWLVNLKTISRPYHFHLGPIPNILF